MSVHYSGGNGKLYDKDTSKPIAKIKYQLVETDRTQYSAKKWWGEFSAGKQLKAMGDCVIELEGNRRGLCYVNVNSDKGSRLSSQHYYRFYGRGKLSGNSFNRSY